MIDKWCVTVCLGNQAFKLVLSLKGFFMSKIVFPLAHEVFVTCPIKLEEQQELAAVYGLDLVRVQAELHVLVRLMESGESPKVRSPAKLRRAIRQHFDRVFVDRPDYVPARTRITQLHLADKPKYAVFMRSESGQSAKFQYLHDTLDSAIACCRQYAFAAFQRNKLDFTFYAVEIKHRVGIEHGKIIDETIE